MTRPSPAVLALFLSLAASPAHAGPTIRGTIRSATSGHPLSGVLVEILEAGRFTLTDSAGQYVVSNLPVGKNSVRFSRRDHREIVAEVTLEGEEVFQLDATLTPLPTGLAEVRVTGVPDQETALATAEAGRWRAGMDAVERPLSLDEPDALRVLSASPQVSEAPEAPATIHVRGGSADQNLILLDGVPVYNPIHSGEMFSAFDPAMIKSVTLHGGIPSARYGGRLSGIIDVRTRRVKAGRLSSRAGINSTAGSASVDVPIAGLNGGLSLSARHSYAGITDPEHGSKAGPNGWVDMLGRLSVSKGDNDLELLFFTSADDVFFANAANSQSTVRSSGQTPATSPQRGLPTLFEWSTTTSALIWRRAIRRGIRAESRAWATSASASIEWPPANGSPRLFSSAQNTGASSLVSWTGDNGVTSLGLEVERFPTSYAWTDSLRAVDSVSAERQIRLGSAPAIGAISVERKQVIGSHWTLSTGVRGTAVTGHAPNFEPRLSLTLDVSEGLGISVGYARSHQYMQSLRNHESLLDEIIGIDLPVATGTAEVPVASGDEVAAAATVPLGGRTRLGVTTYSRWLRDLVLVAPVSLQPFATESFARGVGRAWGTGVTLEGGTSRSTWSAEYAFGAARRAAFTKSWRPSFVPVHAASIGSALLVGEHTRLRAFVSASRGRLTTPVTDGFSWEWQGLVTRARRLNGVPQNSSREPCTHKLPLYLRLDVGATHDFQLGRSSITAFGNLDNFLDRRNTIGYSVSRGSTNSKAIRMMPLSASFGLQWHF